MVVCPSCRNVNEEGLQACSRCGTSLEPTMVSLMPVRRAESERPPIELRRPPTASASRPYVVLGLLALVIVGVGVALLVRPNPCSGTNFESPNFGYCILVPEGWEAGPARFGDQVTLDQFAPPTESATVVVEAVDLENGTALDQWSEFVRARDEEAGLTPGAASEISLDGVGALQWDVSVASEDGETFRMREVVAVRDDVGWRITLNDLSEGFGTTAVVFEGMLESWQFS